MEDRFLQLTATELKIITLLEYSTDFEKDNQVQKLKGLLQKKHYFSSDPGQEYEQAFYAYADENKSPVKCVLCGEQLESKHTFLCPKCRSLVGKTAAAAADEATAIKENGGNDTKKDKKIRTTKSSDTVLREKNKKKRMILGVVIGFVSCIVLAAVVFLISRFVYNRQPERVIERILNRFNSGLNSQGMQLGLQGLGEDGATVYEILPQKDLLLLYVDEDGRFEATALIMAGNDSEANAKHIMLMQMLNMSMNEEMTEEEAYEHVQNMVVAGGEYHYEDYEWLFVPAEDTSYFFVMKENLSLDEIGKITNTSVSVDSNEISNLLGGDYKIAETLLGESIQIIAENTRYYEGEGISLIYSQDSGKVLYIDLDGSGTDGKTYSICGICFGMTKEQAITVLKQYGYAAGNGTSDVYTVSMDVDGEKRELSVTVRNDVVVMVSYSIIN